MKKLILSLGAISLAVLPVVAIASCSSSQGPSITNEVAKFERSFTAKETAKAITPQEAVDNISKAETPEGKWNALALLVELPPTSVDFNYEVQSASINISNDSSINVSIKISEKNNDTNNKVFTLVVEGLITKAGKLLADQAALLINAKVLAAKNTQVAAEAQSLIKDRSTLDTYYTPITMTEGISYAFTSSKVNEINKTTLDVTLTVSDNLGTTPIVRTIQITGFKDLGDYMSDQAALLKPATVTGDLAKKTAAQAAEEIVSTETLLPYYPQVKMGYGVSYAWESDSAVGDTVEVKLVVSSTIPGTSEVGISVVISGFTASNPAQTELEEKAKLLVPGTVTGEKAKETAIMGAKAITSTETLVPYYPKVELGQGFIYSWVSTKPVDDTVSVDVQVSSSTAGTTAINKTIIISGFTSSQKKLVEQADLLINKAVLEAKKSESASEAQSAIKNTARFNTYYTTIPMTEGISYEFVSSSVNETTKTILNVVLNVTSTEPNTTAITKNIQLSEFTTTEARLKEQADLLTNQNVLSGKASESALQAQEAIKDTTIFHSYYTPVKVSRGVSYAFTSSSVNSETKTTLDVTLTVSDKYETTPIVKKIQIAGFAQPSALDNEAERFAISLQALNPATKTNAVVRTLNEATDENARFEFLKTVVNNFPTSTQGFTFVVGQANLNLEANTSVNVLVTVSSSASKTSRTVTFTVTNLTSETAQAELQRLATSLVNKPAPDSKRGETAAQAASTIGTSVEKLNEYYPTIHLGKEISYNIRSSIASVNTVIVTLNIVSTNQSLSPVVRAVRITNFTSPVEIEAKRFNTSVSANDRTVTTAKVIADINAAQGDEKKLEIVKAFVGGFPEANTGFSFMIDSAQINPNANTSVDVILTLTQTNTQEEKVATFTITNLTASQTN